MSAQIRRQNCLYLQNLNANEKTAYKNSTNIALILLKRNAFFIIGFAYYNVAHSKIRRSRFIHNKGPAMSYETWSVARRHET
jgi:hypothetical protein